MEGETISESRPLRIYVASSWRNLMQQGVVHTLRADGFEVYDYRQPEPGCEPFGWRDIDPNFAFWQPGQFVRNLEHPLADVGFSRDMFALDNCDLCILVLPCGRSAHLEAGYAMGKGKPTAILITEQTEPELMYKMTGTICLNLGELLCWCEGQRDKRMGGH